MSAHPCWKCGKPLYGQADVCGECGAGHTEISNRKKYFNARGVFRLEVRRGGRGGWSGPDLRDQLEYMREHQSL